VELRDAAAAINAIPGVVVVSDLPALNLLEFARHLRPETGLRLGAESAKSLSGELASRAVLVAPSRALLETMNKLAANRGETFERWLPGDRGFELWRIGVPARPSVKTGPSAERSSPALRLQPNMPASDPAHRATGT
jgi:hypothetical protein